jgi:hypothetical protein
VRSLSGAWDYYTAEDLVDGWLVFAEVERCELINDGRVPNDTINRVDVIEQSGDVFTVELSIDSVGPDAEHYETVLRVRCKSLHLEDSARPGTKIID